MKKVLSVFLSIVMLLSITAGLNLTASAETTSDDFEYTVLDDGTAEIIGYTGSASDLTIPSTLDGYTVTRIDEDAFYQCSNLTSVTIPDGVKKIYDYAFDDCERLQNIKIESSSIHIQEDAFYQCYNIQTLTLASPDESFFDSEYTNYVKDIFPYLTAINIEESASDYSSIDGVVFSKDKTELILFPTNKSGNYSVPDGTINIAERAFYNCTNLTSVTIPDSVTSIGSYAFSDCASLTSVAISNSVTSIGSSAFYNTGYYNDSSNWENDVLYIDNYLIEAKNTILEDYDIVPGTILIAGGAFAYCTSLTSVTIPDSVTSIGNSAFCDCTGLTSVVIPDSVKSIKCGAFAYCNALEKVVFPENMEQIEADAFRSTGLKEVNVPNGITNLDSAFTNCRSLTTLNIPASVEVIDWNNGDGGTGAMLSSLSALTDINVSSDNTVYSSIDGVLFDKEQTKLLHYPSSKADESYTVPSGVKYIKTWSIGNYYWGFCTNEYLKNIVLPNTVIEIETCAIISSCLESITIPASVTNIYDNSIVNEILDYSGDSEDTILPVTVYGYNGTEAQQYANMKGYPFIDLNSLSIDSNEPAIPLEPTIPSNPIEPSQSVTQPSVAQNEQSAPSVQQNTQQSSQTAASTQKTATAAAKPAGAKKVDGVWVNTKQKKAAVKKLTKAKKAFKITWKKVSGVTGYQIQYSTSKKFTKKTTKSVTVSSNKAKSPSKTIKKLKSKKTYYVRIRTYKTVKLSGKNVKVYSSWSKAKSVKTK